MQHFQDVEPGSEQSCLRAIVRTGNPEIDRLSQAIEQASSDEMVMLVLALSRQSTPSLPPKGE